MQDTKASQTALLIAGYRARANQRKDALYTDPWARGLAGDEGEALAADLDRIYPAMQLWVDVRTSYLDRLVRRYQAPPRSFRQVVLLGAGFDTRAARLASPGTRFFEIDHPASQALKKDGLSRLDGYPMDAAVFVACDFERESAVSALGRSAFDFDAPALILWEGVTPYLQESSVRTTVRAIADACHEDTVLVFDYLLKPSVAPTNPKKHAQGFVARLGEPVVWGTNDVLPMLYEEGMRSVESASFDDLCPAITGTYERAREFRFQRIAVASKGIGRFAALGDPR